MAKWIVRFVGRLLVASLGFCVLTPTPGAAQAPQSPEAQAGWQALQAGDADRAATAFYAALMRDPRDPFLHLGAAAAAHLLGHDRDAEVSLNRALELSPRLTAASDLLGQLQYAKGDTAAAIRTYEQALKYGPGTESMQARLEAWKREAVVDRNLTERSDGRFTITFEGRADEALATHAMAVLEAEFLRIGQTLGGYPSDRILVTLYSDEQFRDVTRAPGWAGGLFDGKIRMPVRGASQNLKAFDPLLTHELTHAMVASVAPRGVPAWLHEGLAQYFQRADAALAQRQLNALGIVVPLSQIQESFSRLTETQAAVAYAESLVAADVLLRLVGTRMTIVLQGLATGLPLEQSLGRAGVRLSDFESQLTQRLEARQPAK